MEVERVLIVRNHEHTYKPGKDAIQEWYKISYVHLRCNREDERGNEKSLEWNARGIIEM